MPDIGFRLNGIATTIDADAECCGKAREPARANSSTVSTAQVGMSALGGSSCTRLAGNFAGALEHTSIGDTCLVSLNLKAR